MLNICPCCQQMLKKELCIMYNVIYVPGHVLGTGNIQVNHPLDDQSSLLSLTPYI